MWFIPPTSLLRFLSFLTFLSAVLAVSVPSVPGSPDLHNGDKYRARGGSDAVITVTIQGCPASATGLSSNGGSLSHVPTSPMVSYPYVSTSESGYRTSSVASSSSAVSYTRPGTISSGTAVGGSSTPSSSNASSSSMLSGASPTSTCTTSTTVGSSLSSTATFVTSSANGTPTSEQGTSSSATLSTPTTGQVSTAFTTTSSHTSSVTKSSSMSSAATKTRTRLTITPSGSYSATTESSYYSTETSSSALTTRSSSSIATESSRRTSSTTKSTSTSLTIPISTSTYSVNKPTTISKSSSTSVSVKSSSSPSSPSSTSQRTASTVVSNTNTSIKPTTSSTRSTATSATITTSSIITSNSTSTSTSSFSSSSSSIQTSSTSSTSKSTSLTTTHTSVSTSSSLTTLKTSSTRISSTSTSSTSTSSSPTPTCDYWFEDIKHQGIAPFNPNKDTYQVFRNVKEYGAKGDGITDDTAAINSAISSGDRCGPATCNSSTITPAVVYFPPGTYLVSGSIIDYYYTQIIGNPKCLPIIKGSSSFNARWIIDADQYQPGGALGFGNLATNVFWRQIRNFIIDLTEVPSIRAAGADAGSPVAGIHWPTAQATSLQNIVFIMSENANTGHEGIFLESGSGGFMTDLVFYGGQYGIEVANQQFTMRNLTFFNANTAIHQLFDWGWTYKGVSINNCSIGLDMTSLNNGVQSVGSVVLIDSEISNTPVGIAVSRDATSTPATGGTLVLENVRLENVGVAIQAPGANTVLAGSSGTMTIPAWTEGNVYLPSGPTAFQGQFAPNSRPASLTAGVDYYERSKPQYESVLASEFVSVRAAGAKGDGVTDDSDILIAVIAEASSAGKIVFFDAGYYLVTKTIYIPSGSRIVGETYPVILSSGAFFNDMSNPQPVVQIGKPGEKGTIEWSDMIISTKGGQAGAILIEWNLDASVTTPAGAWDVHSRVGGFLGSDLQVSQCPKTPNTEITSNSQIPSKCIAAFLDMHITKSAAGVYLENNWLWVADHDADDADLTQISVYAGRGLLIESTTGQNWLYGTAVEHHTLYQYQLSNTADTFLGFIQTESPYYQPNPAAPIPFTSESAFSDPVFATNSKQSAWGLRVVDSTDVLIYGAGHYSFFSDYNVTCSDQGEGETCQKHIVDIENSALTIYGLNTVGTTEMITFNGADEAPAAANDDGFVSTIAIFRSS